MKDFFISYQGRDVAWAQWIAAELEAAGLSTLYQHRDFEAGADFVRAIDEGLAGSRATLLVVSDAYLESFWTQRERDIALAREKGGAKVLPVRIAPVRELGVLAAHACVDLYTLEEAVARDRLVAAAGGVRAAEPRSSAVRFPGFLRRTVELPFLRNPFFVGRDDVVETLRRRRDAAGGATAIDALCGLAGVGKTQVAVEYAHRHARDYRSVLWVEAHDAAALTAGFSRVARKLADAPAVRGDTALPDLVTIVADRLTQEPGWLLVLDNVDDVDLVRPCVPTCGGGHVLVTTRLAELAGLGVALPIRLAEFAHPDSVAFLLRRTGRDAPPAGSPEAESIDFLARELGGLPLALEQCAAYVAQGASFAAYAQAFRGSRLVLLESSAPQASPYAGTLAAVLRLALARVEERSRAAADLLRASAFLAADAIPLEMVARAGGADRVSLVGMIEQLVFAPEDRQHASVLGPHLRAALDGADQNPLRAFAVIEPLVRYSLVRLDASRESYSVHRLLQEVVRDMLGADGRARWAGRAVEMLHAALAAVPRPVHRAPAERLMPHARAAIAHASRDDPDEPLLPRLAELSGLALFDLGAFGDARALLEGVVAGVEAKHGPDDERFAVALHNLGSLYNEVGAYAESEATLRRALSVREGAAGNPVSRAKTLDALGSLLTRSGRAAEAEPLHRAALTALRAATSDDAPALVATSCQFLSACLAGLGRIDEARERVAESIAIYRRILPKAIELAIGLYNLAALTGDHRQALVHLAEARAIAVAAYGPGHHWVARNDLYAGRRQLSLGAAAEAEALLAAAIHGIEAAFGPAHHELGAALAWQAEALERQGRLDEAAPLLERAHALCVRVKGAASADALQLLVNRMQNLAARRLPDAVLPLADELIAAFERLCPGSAELGFAWTNRGAALFGLMRYAEARAAHERARALLDALPAPPFGDLAVVHNNIATTFHAERDLAAAERHYRISVELFARAAPDHPQRPSSARNLAGLLRASDRAAEAEAIEASIGAPD